MSRPALVQVLASACHGAYRNLCQLRDRAQKDGPEIERILGILFCVTLMGRSGLRPLVWQAYQDSMDKLMREMQAKAAAGARADDI